LAKNIFMAGGPTGFIFGSGLPDAGKIFRAGGCEKIFDEFFPILFFIFLTASIIS